MSCAHILVTGVVQGVGFRYFVVTHARNMGLTGWARNLPNGDVEIEAAGERGMVDELIKKIRIGPVAAHVASVNCEWLEDEKTYRDFEVRY